MNKQEHYKQVKKLVENCLLHLYMQIRYSKQYTPNAKRQVILVRYLKAQEKSPKYKAAKKEIKTLLIRAKRSHINIESKLWALNHENQNIIGKISEKNDIQKFADLLDDLYVNHGFESKMANDDDNNQLDILYMQNGQVDIGFDENNNQVRPVTLHINCHQQQQLKLASAIQESATFNSTWRIKDNCHYLELMVAS